MKKTRFCTRRAWTVGSAAAAVFGCAGLASAGGAKNVILMIADGQGFNVVKATDYYVGSAAVYESFPVKFGVQTSSANNPTGYSPAGMAASFNYSKTAPTDSSSSATAMYTGVKIYDGELNWTTSDQPLTTFFEKAAWGGRSIGAVSTVEFTHATPATVFGHNSSRNNYSEMAREAIYGSNPNSHNGYYDAGNYGGNLKVVMGAGNPDYDVNGLPQTANYTYVGGAQAWTDLQNGTNGWTLVQSKAEFGALATGPTPAKVFGVAQNISTLQQDRTNAAGNFDAKLTNQPTLADMTRGALNVLDNAGAGFAVMIEGGAVDWANHDNQADRMIEEEMDFNDAVQSVCDYLDADTNGNDWGNTLLIVTADHETGHLWGATNGVSTYFDVNGNSQFDAGVDYPHIGNNGQGALPGVKYNSTGHTNSLVPLFAKGAGSELFAGKVVGTEANLRALYGLDASWTGQYIDNTGIHDVMTAAAHGASLTVSDFIQVQANFGRNVGPNGAGDLTGDGVVNASDVAYFQANFGGMASQVIGGSQFGGVVPEPSALGLLSMGAAGVFGRRRRSLYH